MTNTALQERLRQVSGLDIRSHTSQRGAMFTYGYANVFVPGLGEYGDGGSPRKPITAKGRKEGDPSRSDQPHTGTFKTWTELVQWAVDILTTGRTLECGKGADIPNPHDLWPPFCPCDCNWEMLTEEILGERPGCEAWDLNPDYQRGHVWTDEQGEKFIGHMLEGGQVPLVFVQRYESQKNVPKGVDYSDLPNEVIDGQQRLRAICRFIRGEIGADLSDGRKVWYKDFHEIERRMVPNIKVAFLDIDRVTRLRFYLRLNRGGTVHTDEEIQHVRNLLGKEGE